DRRCVCGSTGARSGRDAEAKRRTLIGGLAFIAAAGLAGDLVTCAIYPAPVMAHQVAVPALRGVVANDAMARLTEVGLRGRLSDTVADPMVPAGTIAWQSPVSATALPEGAVVKLGVSSGAQLVSVPDVVDFNLDLAQQVIQAAGLRSGAVDTLRNN